VRQWFAPKKRRLENEMNETKLQELTASEDVDNIDVQTTRNYEGGKLNSAEQTITIWCRRPKDIGDYRSLVIRMIQKLEYGEWEKSMACGGSDVLMKRDNITVWIPTPYDNRAAFLSRVFSCNIVKVEKPVTYTSKTYVCQT